MIHKSIIFLNDLKEFNMEKKLTLFWIVPVRHSITYYDFSLIILDFFHSDIFFFFFFYTLFIPEPLIIIFNSWKIVFRLAKKWMRTWINGRKISPYRRENKKKKHLYIIIEYIVWILIKNIYIYRKMWFFFQDLYISVCIYFLHLHKLRSSLSVSAP